MLVCPLMTDSLSAGNVPWPSPLEVGARVLTGTFKPPCRSRDPPSWGPARCPQGSRPAPGLDGLLPRGLCTCGSLCGEFCPASFALPPPPAEPCSGQLGLDLPGRLSSAGISHCPGLLLRLSPGASGSPSASPTGGESCKDGVSEIHCWTLFLGCFSVAQSCLTLCGPMSTRLPCPSLSARVCSDSCPLSQ